MHYVIGDVHGCYDEMTALLAKIESMDPEAEIWFVGDFIDRGPKVWETLCWAMEHIAENGLPGRLRKRCVCNDLPENVLGGCA